MKRKLFSSEFTTEIFYYTFRVSINHVTDRYKCIHQVNNRILPENIAHLEQIHDSKV